MKALRDRPVLVGTAEVLAHAVRTDGMPGSAGRQRSGESTARLAGACPFRTEVVPARRQTTFGGSPGAAGAGRRAGRP
ncbi:MAG: hypothetical protein ACREJ0_01395, partial [Geminicoccaceae bacterium]